MRVIVYLAHPRPDRSEANEPLFDVARKMPEITTVDLYAEYPDFYIDIDREQDRLQCHDVIVFQHPLYWYSIPALLKEWFDLVLEHGFAYGHDGTALTDKIALNVVTTGANREAYTSMGSNGAELRELFLPIQKSIELCHMHYLPPFALFGAGRATEEGRMIQHLDQYRTFLQALSTNRIDIVRAKAAITVNEAFSEIVHVGGGE